jgi:hypothetical protein
MSTKSFPDNTKQQSVIICLGQAHDKKGWALTMNFYITGADFLTKEVMVGDKLVTMQVSVINLTSF